MSESITKPPNTNDHCFALTLTCDGNITRAKLDGNHLKQDKTTSTHDKKISIICIDYEVNLWNYVASSDPTIGKSLPDAFKLVKKTMTLVNTRILDMVLDLIQKEHFHFLLMDVIKMQ